MRTLYVPTRLIDLIFTPTLGVGFCYCPLCSEDREARNVALPTWLCKERSQDTDLGGLPLGMFGDCPFNHAGHGRFHFQSPSEQYGFLCSLLSHAETLSAAPCFLTRADDPIHSFAHPADFLSLNYPSSQFPTHQNLPTHLGLYHTSENHFDRQLRINLFPPPQVSQKVASTCQ